MAHEEILENDGYVVKWLKKMSCGESVFSQPFGFCDIVAIYDDCVELFCKKTRVCSDFYGNLFLDNDILSQNQVFFNSQQECIDSIKID